MLHGSPAWLYSWIGRVSSCALQSGSLGVVGLVEALGPFHHVPAVVPSAAVVLRVRRRLHVDLLLAVLSHVADVERAALAVEGEAEGVAQAAVPDLVEGLAGADVGVVGRNGVVVGEAREGDVDADQLAEQGARVLRRLLRVALAAAVAEAHVQHPVGAEGDGASVVVVVRLLEGQQDLLVRVGDVRVARARAEARDAALGLGRGAAGGGVVDVERPGRGVVLREGDARAGRPRCRRPRGC